ncbi:FbpB family small basic protein [Pallidibacillus pasinlerensis]|nr:FbpB family small basic protein [Pallidibacillus pasinlerensis]
MGKLKKNRKMSFEELVRENKLEILKSEEELDRIERKIEERQLRNAE